MNKQPAESWESFVERRIREAAAEGEFDHLAGIGQPIADIDEPWDENSWVRKKLAREQINALPPILTARLDKERTLESLVNLKTEAEVRSSLLALNERIHKAHFAAAAGPSGGILPIDIEAEVRRWQLRPT